MSTDVPDLESHTVAWFRSSKELRAAEGALERHGIESQHILVGAPPVQANRRQIDRKTWSSLGSRALVGVVIGVLVGVALGLVIGLALGNGGSDLVGWMLALGVAGAPLGGIYMVATRLPAQGQTFDSYGGDQQVEEWLAVGGPDDLQSQALEVLQQQNPVRISGHAA